MKGFVFTFGNNQKMLRLPQLNKNGYDLRQLLTRCGIQTVFTVLFLLGLIVGAACSRSFSQETYDKLDLLFVTNLSARQEMNLLEFFISCFVSYFLFVFCVFLSGNSIWGFTAIPLLSAFKGFTVGLSSAFIFSLYQLSGIGFYILVVLPGTVLFLFTFINYSARGFRMSLCYLRMTMFGYEKEPMLRDSVKRFVKKTIFALICSGACAVVDMVLWLLFAGKFTF